MVLLDGGEQSKVFSRRVEDSGVVLGFVHLFLELRLGPLIAISACLGSELWVHGRVLIGLAFYRQVEALLEDGVLLFVVELGGITDYQIWVK
jgi:hypothetical protein